MKTLFSKLLNVKNWFDTTSTRKAWFDDEFSGRDNQTPAPASVVTPAITNPFSKVQPLPFNLTRVKNTIKDLLNGR